MLGENNSEAWNLVAAFDERMLVESRDEVHPRDYGGHSMRTVGPGTSGLECHEEDSLRGAARAGTQGEQSYPHL